MFRILTASLLLLLVAGCTRHDVEKQAERDFKERFPDYRIARIYLGKGDVKHVSLHIRYKHAPASTIPPAEITSEMIFGYEKQSNRWQLVSQQSGVIPGGGLERIRQKLTE